MPTGGFYGTTVFDPILIVAQIIVLQCIWYLTLGVFLQILRGGGGGSLTLFPFFDPQAVGGGKARASGLAWRTAFAFLLSSAVGAGFLAITVERAKKCLDFATTLYILHLVLVICYAGWPTRFEWWLLQLACLATTAIGGEYLCLQREMRDIPLGVNVERRAACSTGGAGKPPSKTISNPVSIEMQQRLDHNGSSTSSASGGTYRQVRQV